MCQEHGLGPLGRDINECETMPDLCTHGLCINTLGSFRCSCNRGYKPDSTRTSCQDINECTQVSRTCNEIIFRFIIDYFSRIQVHVNTSVSIHLDHSSVAVPRDISWTEMDEHVETSTSAALVSTSVITTVSTLRAAMSACVLLDTNNTETDVWTLMNVWNNRYILHYMGIRGCP